MDQFNAERIFGLLRCLNGELSKLGSSRRTIVVVGGSSLALMGLRESTSDVDVISKIDADFEIAIGYVSVAENLSLKWLNSSAGAFVPQDFDNSRCSLFANLSNLRILLIQPDDLFIMKLFASRGARDFVDLVALWPICSFENTAMAIKRYWTAYPAAYPDEFLEEFVKRIADLAI